MFIKSDRNNAISELIEAFWTIHFTFWEALHMLGTLLRLKATAWLALHYVILYTWGELNSLYAKP